MTLKPNALPKQGGTGWVSHLNYEKERNLEIHHSDADSDSDGHRHHARRHLVHDVVVSPTTKENLPTLFIGAGRFLVFNDSKTIWNNGSARKGRTRKSFHR